MKRKKLETPQCPEFPSSISSSSTVQFNVVNTRTEHFSKAPAPQFSPPFYEAPSKNPTTYSLPARDDDLIIVIG